MKQHITYTLILLFLAYVVIGQPINKYIDDVVQPSPNEAALGKYLDIPVSHSTGIPSISVPIFNIIQGPLSHSVSVNYHAGGIKVEEMASRVGLGWILNAGGLVSRTVLGVKDEDITHKGYYHNGSDLDNVSTSNWSTNEIQQLLAGNRDGEPDLFSFSCGGYSGQFYFNKNREPILIQKKDVRISTFFNNSKFVSFTIITPDGNRHIFGKYGNSEAYTTTQPNGSTIPYITTWHLLRTETYDKTQAISFGYENDKYRYTSSASCKAQTTYCDDPQNTNWSANVNCSSNAEFVFGNTRFRYHTTTINGKRLKSISSKNETIIFHSLIDREDLSVFSTPKSKQLNRISISSGNSSYCKEFNFDYGYFSDGGHQVDDNGFTVHAAKRLKLNSIQETSCESSPSILIPSYTFSYNTTALPFRHSKQIDHWGYFNGKSQNDTKFVNVPPSTVLGITYGSSDRSTDPIRMKAGSLSSIKYPTGGETFLDLEANRIFSTSGNTTQLFTPFNNCTTPGPAACCGTPDVRNFTYTFPANTNQLSLDIELSKISSSGICGNSNVMVDLEIKRTSNNNTVFAESVNLTSGLTTETISFDDSYLTGINSNTQYKFELNVYNGRAEVSMNGISAGDEYVGGLRVKQAKQVDGITNNDIITDYTYDDGGESSGVLLFKPEYGYSFFGISGPGTQGISSHTNSLVFTTSSYVPMSSYENNHIIYEKVQLSYNGNGSKEITLHASPLINYYAIFPYGQPFYNENNGIEKVTLLRDDSYNSIVSSKEVEPYSNNQVSFSIGNIFKVSGLFLNCSLANATSTLGAISNYQIRSAMYRPGIIKNKLDGVETVTENQYNTTEDYYSLTRSTVTNSDGKKYHTFNTYPHDNPGVGQNQNLIDLNLVVPIKTTQRVGSNPNTAALVDENITVYSSFTTAHGTFPYPSEYKRQEITWNGTTIDDNGIHSLAVINSYDTATGKPTSITIDGWDDPMEYEWNPNGTLKEKNFIDYKTSYTYKTGTKLLATLTNPDNQVNTYEYDKIFRLKTTNDLNRDVSSTLKYVYNQSNSKNYIETKTTYKKLGENFTDHALTNRSFFDGLGRNIQLQKLKQGSTINNNVIITKIYDNRSRVIKEFEPYEISVNPSGYINTAPSAAHTSFTYEQSPLNRVLTSKMPSQTSSKIYDYRSNNTNEVYRNLVNNFYAPNTLNVTSITDEKEIEDIIYTDRLGRNILKRRKGTSGIPVSTYTRYDDKHRVTKVFPPGTVPYVTAYAPNLYSNDYYGNDLLKRKDFPSQQHISYEYDDRDLMTTWHDGRMRSSLGGIFDDVFMEYDDYGRLIKKSFGGGSQTLSKYTYVEDGENGEGKIKEELSWLLCDSGICDGRQVSYYYDAASRIVKIEDGTTQLSDGFEVITGPGFDFFSESTKKSKITKGFYDKLNADGSIEPLHHLAHLVSSKKSNTYNCVNQVPTIKYDYDSADNIIRKDVSACFNSVSSIEGDVSLTKYYPFDFAGRSLGEDVSFRSGTNFQNQGSRYNMVRRTYNAKSQLSELNLGNNLQNIEYTYLNNGYLSSISSKNPGNAALINVQYSYEANGNISDMDVTSSQAGLFSNSYSYDYLDRISSFSLSGNGSASSSYQYEDVKGNLKVVKRNVSGSDIDDLLYTYNNDRIIKIDDRKNNASGYNENTKKSYMYDDNGNIVKDPSKSTNGSTEAVITYNYMNLPGYVDFGNKEIQFYYKDDGSLFKKEIIVNGKIDYARIYFDDLEFHLDYNGISNAYDDVQEGRVDLIKFSEGYLIPSAQCNNTANLSLSGNDHNTGMTYGAGQIGSVANLKTGHIDYKASDRITLSNGFTTDTSSSFTANIQAVNCQEEINGNGSKFVPFYTIKNHLGNNIMEFTKNGSNEPSVAVEHKYFPFGLELTDPITPTGYEYLYNSKEKHDDFDLGYYNFNTRFYDPAIGRFTGVDMIADQLPHLSTYNYASNNPVTNIDLYGMQGIDANALDEFYNDYKENGLGSAISNYFNLGSLFTGTSEEKAETLSKVHEVNDVAENINNTVENAVISGAEAVGASGEVVSATGDVMVMGGSVVTPVAPEVGIPMVEGGMILKGAGATMQMSEDLVKGDFKEMGKKAIVKSVPGRMGKPLRNAIDKMDKTSPVSKEILKQQVRNGEVIVGKALNEKLKDN